MRRDLDRQSSRSSRHHQFLIKLRGIPYTSTKDDIRRFLSPCRHVDIHLFSNNGTSSGECLVDLESEADVRDAMKKNREFMGKRYIEVFRATPHEFAFFFKHQGMISWREPVIRMRGLPVTCTMANVQNFFQDTEIATNGIYISRDMSDEASGDGFVAFVNMDHGYKAIELYDRRRMQHSTIDLSPSTYDEAKRAIMNDAFVNGKRFADEDDVPAAKKTDGRNHRSRSRQPSRSRSRNRNQRDRPARSHRPSAMSPRPRSSRPQMKTIDQRSRDDNRRRTRSRSPISRPLPKPDRNGEYRMKMRGMPYTIKENDVVQFFPSSCRPVRIEILHDRQTEKPNGDGYAYFNSPDKAKEALKCDRNYMGNRYVELYFESSRQASAERQPSKNIESPRESSHSSRHSENQRDNRSRSRSESQHE